jgi:hypothetical protein
MGPPDGKGDTYQYQIRQVHVEDTRFGFMLLRMAIGKFGSASRFLG